MAGGESLGDLSYKSLAGNAPESWGNECPDPKGRDLAEDHSLYYGHYFIPLSIHLLGIKCLAGKLSSITASVLGWQLDMHYLPLLPTLHSPYPGTSAIQMAYLMGLSRTSSLKGVGPWSQGLSQSVASAFVHPLSKVDRKVPKEAPMDHWVLNIFFLPPLCNRSPILFR